MKATQLFKTILETPRFITTSLYNIFNINSIDVLLGGLKPTNIDKGLMFWSKGQNLPRTTWNEVGHQINNEVATLPPKKENRGLKLTSTNSDYIRTASGLDSYNTIQFWIYLDSVVDEVILGFTGFTQKIKVLSGVITYTSIPGSQTTYVNGIQTTTITTGWNHVRMVSSLPITNQIDIGYDDSTAAYGDFTIKDFSLSFNGVSYYDFTPNEIADIWSDCALFYPLADYNPDDGVRTAGDRILDYSGNANHGTAQGTSVTSVFTPNIGYQVSEDAYNEYTFFDGVNDNITFSNGSVLDTTITVGLFIDNVTTEQRVFDFGDGRLAGEAHVMCLMNRDGAGSLILYSEYNNLGVGNRFGFLSGLTRGFHVITATTDTDGNLTGATLDGVSLNAYAGATRTGSLGIWQLGKIQNVDLNTFDGFFTHVSITQNDSTPILATSFPTWEDTVGSNDGAINISSTDNISVYEVSADTDLSGTAIPPFTGSAAPNGQLFTGGGIAAVATNLDHVDFPNYGDENFTFSLWVDVSSLTAFEYLLGGTGTASYLSYLGSGEWRVRFAAGLMNFSGFSTSGWHMISFTADSTTVTMYEDGVSKGSLARSGTTTALQYIGRRASSYANMDFTDAFFSATIWTAPQLLELYNNPNKFVELMRADSGAYFAYDFNGGTYDDGYPVIDVSGNGNHGVMSCVGDIAVNNLEIGSQTALHGWSEYNIFEDTTSNIRIAGGINLNTYNNVTVEVDMQVFNPNGVNATSGILFAQSSVIFFGCWQGSSTSDTYFGVGTPLTYVDDVLVANRGAFRAALVDDGRPHTVKVTGLDLTNAAFANGMTLNGYAANIVFALDHCIIKQVRIDLTSNGIFDHQYDLSTLTDVIGAGDDGVVTGTLAKAIIPSATDISTTDIFGNTVSRAWKVGILNPTGLQSPVCVLTNSGDLKSRTYGLIALQIGRPSDHAYLLNHRDADAGINWDQRGDGSVRIDVEDDTGGSPSTMILTGMTIVGNNINTINIHPNGRSDGYKGTDSVAMAFQITDNTGLEDVGITGSDDLLLGRIQSVNYDIPFSVLIYHDHPTLAEQEKLRKYLIKLIP